MQRSLSLLLLLLLPVLALGRPDPPKPDVTILPGTLKFSDDCTEDRECGFDGSYCDPKVKRCLCREEFRATNHIDKCGHAANINESCFFTEQCEVNVAQTECRDGRCICIFEKVPVQNKDGSIQCIAEIKEPQDLRYVDPAMIGILAGMALMFIIICIVLRLFSQARWRENRTIFNTPNARLMNVSLLRDNKLLHGQERRGSRASVRGPSRQPSMASLRAHSPNASQDEKILLNNDKGKRAGSNECAAFAPVQDTRIMDHCTSPLSPGSKMGSRRGSRGSGGSQAGGAANKSNRSPPNHQEPVLENVTVEIIEDKS